MGGKTSSCTVVQPWRGIFGVVIIAIIAFGITYAFNMEAFQGIFVAWAMPMVPTLIVMGLVWGAKFPPTGKLPRVVAGLVLLAFTFVVGTIIYFIIRYLMSAGVPQPFSNVYLISTVLLTFWWVLGFGTWPLDKLPMVARGFVGLICMYLIMWGGIQLFNFSMLSYPTGVNPSPIGAVPFYAAGGPLAAFGALAPKGPFPWESAIACWFWTVVYVFIFVPALEMWPFRNFSAIMKQPILGIVIFIVCLVLTLITWAIAVLVIKVEPIMFLLVGVSFLFGLLMILNMFQAWPGRLVKGPAGGFINIIVAVVIGFIGFYAVKAFNTWHFGAEAMAYPAGLLSMANVMLALMFPGWAMYASFFDFWPLPPSPAPPK